MAPSPTPPSAPPPATSPSGAVASAASADEPSLEARLAATLAPCTFQHSLAVRDQCAALAPLFGVDPRQAALAGLLHDCAKNLPAEHCLAAATEANLALHDAERETPKVLHQRLGAHLAETRYGLSDPAVQRAIACHTTGHGEMDALARCLFVADYTSADRDYVGVEGLRDALAGGADAAFRAVLAFKREYVIAKGLPEHPWAEDAYRRWL